MTGFPVKINPRNLKYAIETSGFTLESFVIALKRKKFTLSKLKDILSGDVEPLHTELKNMDRILKRGILFYFLPTTPEEKNIISYRAKERNSLLEPEHIPKLREYYYKRFDITSLLDNIGEKNSVTFAKHSISKNPLTVASEMREKLDYSPDNFYHVKSSQVFTYLRSKIEANGIFVFKDDIGANIRGCIFTDGDAPPLILINSNDDKNAEIFSLLHELAHFLLRNDEIDTANTNNETEIEKWCNSFAFSFLFSSDEQKKENIIKGVDVLNPDCMHTLSKRYCVSKLALAYSYYLSDLISKDDFEQFQKKQKKSNLNKKKRGGGNYYATLGTRLSGKYLDILNTNFVRNKISISELANLSRTKSYERFQEVLGRA